MKRYLLLILILPILAGCNSFLDQLPDDRTVIDTPEKMKELMVSAYDISLPIAFNEFMSDNVEDFGSGSTIYDQTTTGKKHRTYPKTYEGSGEKARIHRSSAIS